jgi:hypothetical protein
MHVPSLAGAGKQPSKTTVNIGICRSRSALRVSFLGAAGPFRRRANQAPDARMADYPEHPRDIQTKWATGYRLVPHH